MVFGEFPILRKELFKELRLVRLRFAVSTTAWLTMLIGEVILGMVYWDLQ